MSKITLEKYGTADKTLITFPGWIHPIENEKKFLDLLRKKYTVYSICLPGYVNNKNSNSYINFREIAGDIQIELMDIKNKNIVYVGFSMGCRLIMELEKQFPSVNKKIFVGSPVSDFKIPFWARLLLLNSKLINFLRRFDLFKLYIVNKALKKITQNHESVFKAQNVTLSGAFDSLVGLIQSQTNFEKYLKSTLFIYGEDDPYLREVENYKTKNLKIITNAEHNCVRDNEAEVVKIIDQYLQL